MTPERIQKTREELLAHWAQLRTSQKAFHGSFSMWRYVFKTAAAVMENPNQNEQINFDQFPEKADLITALAEYQRIVIEIDRTELALEGMGINLRQ